MPNQLTKPVLNTKPSLFEPTYIAVKHHRKNAERTGLYKSKEGIVCRGHKIGFEPVGPRPIIQGCVRCMEKVNGT